MPITSILSERIRLLREANGMTQVDLAKDLFVSKQSVSNWENDNILPSVEMLIKIADRFGVTTDYLLGREQAPRLSVDGLPMSMAEHLNTVIIDLRNALCGESEEEGEEPPEKPAET